MSSPREDPGNALDTFTLELELGAGARIGESFSDKTYQSNCVGRRNNRGMMF